MTLHLTSCESPTRGTDAVTPIGRQTGVLAARASWWLLVRAAAPAVPAWLLGMITAVLAHEPPLTPDALLILAEALDEAAEVLAADGHLTLSAQLGQLAAMPRGLVPSR